MGTPNHLRQRQIGRLGVVAAFLLPVCSGFATGASALDHGSSNTGELRVSAGPGAAWFDYQLSYDVEGTITAAQIRLAQKDSGSFSAWLCGTPANPGPIGTPTCPSGGSGALAGTVSAANVVGPAGAGVASAEFEEFLRAVREGKTTAKLHTTKHPGGEIKGELK